MLRQLRLRSRLAELWLWGCFCPAGVNLINVAFLLACMPEVTLTPVWFDSLGAKSSCILVETSCIRVLVDPGASAMHPSFPATPEEKARWLTEAKQAIREASRRADVIVVTHYHYDHYTKSPELYGGKLLLAKSPNQYINSSQRKRAEAFYGSLWAHYRKESLGDVLRDPVRREYPDPLSELRLALSQDFGDYAERRVELLEKGRRWFEARVREWSSAKVIPELESSRLKVRFADGKQFRLKETTLRFTQPMFHGVEYSRVGWVIPLVVEHGGEKLLYSSDLNGPIVEDYAEWIIREDPDILVLDGPPTYMIPYTLNLINLRRAVKNICRIIQETSTRLILLDHHLLRDRLYRRRLAEAYRLAESLEKNLVTAAELAGRKPKVLEAAIE